MFELNQKKTCQLLIRLTRDERAYIENTAKQSGLNMSEVARRLLKHGMLNPRKSNRLA